MPTEEFTLSSYRNYKEKQSLLIGGQKSLAYCYFSYPVYDSSPAKQHSNIFFKY